MLVRSPRKLVFLSLVAFIFILAVLQQSPWAASNVYEQLPLFQSPTPPHENGSGDASGSKSSDGPDKARVGGKPSVPWAIDGGKTNPLDLGVPEPRPTDLKEYMKNMLNWTRPTWNGHWPPFGDYVDKDYDPNRWEEFEMDYRPYNAGHDKLSKTVASSPQAYKPFPEYNNREWGKKWKGTYVACMGPRGMRLNESADDEVQVYSGVPEGFPKVFAGGYDVIGLDGNVCFDRYSRYGPYGFGDEEFPEDVKDWKAPKTVPEWTEMNWGMLQDECLELNKNRYRPEARTPVDKQPSTTLPPSAVASSAFATPTGTSRGNVENRNAKGPQYHHRTAVLIRAWTGYHYEENDITAIRAMISELSLQSGGEYQVFLYVHVKDRNKPIFDNPAIYDEVLREHVPAELRDVAILWSEAIFPKWYPEVKDWQVYWQQFMCLQWFSLTHPEFDYIWNWETDARYTGHHYHFFEKISEFADMQPRKLLWERNKRYYLPSVHGSYKNFVEQTHADVLNASANSLIPPPVWGPRPWARADPPQKPLGPTPPTSFEDDEFKWGVNEPADFITLLPIWDPRNTSWSYKDKIWNYLPGVRPVFTPQDGAADWFTHPDFIHIDRRVFINTVVRFSKRMLQAMHEENLVGRSMQAEMWPSTVALQHGLKAVYAPHPIFNDRHWPAAYSEAIFDAHSTIDNSRYGPVTPIQGAWTEQADSPYNHDREYNFQGWSWYYASKFPRTLYRRWLNWQVAMQDWGQEERIEGGEGMDGVWQERRMCMPAMLLHPVKRMEREKVKP
ncbi:uncharacterized protein BDR25DRAFT_316432 [Lindgomyces ingoldianus]|uniref:Uncharacterized protein n=1 Tax=Lindgomyces ingoldianus TaxID=673940 RepID=A0ACB6QNV4_9PLEO|nr:uncharacterized protein BDR25DRAFT_316432 [Lindgomyces ingoldianus]KAF2467795.1 hypothetical protein BDR25DRAFT_316432 [Lindgomyces ingoldianus]